MACTYDFSESLKHQIDLKEVNPDLVDKMIRFLYGESMKQKVVTQDTSTRSRFMSDPVPELIDMIDLYITADKFDVPDLQLDCLDNFERHAAYTVRNLDSGSTGDCAFFKVFRHVLDLDVPNSDPLLQVLFRLVRLHYDALIGSSGLQELLPHCPTLTATLLIATAAWPPGIHMVTFFACRDNRCRSKGQLWGAKVRAYELLEQHCIFCGEQSLEIISRSGTAPRGTGTQRRSILCRTHECAKIFQISGMSEALSEISKELKCCACGRGFLTTWLGHKPFDENKSGALRRRKVIRQLEDALDAVDTTDATGAAAGADGTNVDG